MKKYLENLKRQAEENPLAAMAIGAATVTAVAKLVAVNNERQNSKTWAKEVERRRMMKSI